MSNPLSPDPSQNLLPSTSFSALNWNPQEPNPAVILQSDLLIGHINQNPNITALTPNPSDSLLLAQIEGSIATIDPNITLPNDNSFDGLTGEAMDIVKEQLTQFAKVPNFVEKMNLAFGESWDTQAANSLTQDWLNGDFSLIPPVKFVSSAEIGGANGAFASATDTIYLSRELLAGNGANPATVADVLLEEIGHSVDTRLNVADSPGDEGAVFAAVVRDKQLSKPEILALKSEDDTATITLGGKTVFIEQSTPSAFQINLNSTNYSRSGNKFVASNGTGGTYLWCTDFAFGRALEKGLLQNYSGLGGKISGNAGVWDDQAGSWGRQARANSLIVWDPNQGGAGSVGHVGFVERVNSDGSFVISEANFGSARMSFNSRTINPGTNAFNSAKFVYLSGNPTQNPITQNPVTGTLFRGTVDGQLNVRSSPGTNSSIVGSLSPNSSRNFDAVSRSTTVWDAREQRNDDRWFRIQNTNQWVSAAFITGNPLFNGATDGNVNVRSGPGTNFPVVSSLATNNSRTFDATTVGTTHWDAREGKNENRWFRLQNTDRWVSASFITGNPSY
ncbi:hypothetical protein NIES204_24420 [Planktothrix agardhii NIES-204]|nr:hypothetical protein NIES204_24420 [Planktothrix agardhii NIES-204]